MMKSAIGALVMGAAMLAGGLTGGGRKTQFFDRTAANVQSLMLFLAVAALVMPAAARAGRIASLRIAYWRSMRPRAMPVTRV